MPRNRRLVGTGPAAAEVGVDPATLWRWAKSGRVQPELYTAGRQARWDVDKLRRQLAGLQEDLPDASSPEQP